MWNDANFNKFFLISPRPSSCVCEYKRNRNPGNPSFSGNSRDLAQDEEIRASSARARASARISFTSVVALIFVTVHQPAYRARLSAFLIVSARLCHDVHLVGAGSRGETHGGRGRRGEDEPLASVQATMWLSFPLAISNGALLYSVTSNSTKLCG